MHSRPLLLLTSALLAACGGRINDTNTDPTTTPGETQAGGQAGTGGSPAGTGGSPAGTGGSPAGTGGSPVGEGGSAGQGAAAGTAGSAGTGNAGTGGTAAGGTGTGGLSGQGGESGQGGSEAACEDLAKTLYTQLKISPFSGCDAVIKLSGALEVLGWSLSCASGGAPTSEAEARQLAFPPDGAQATRLALSPYLGIGLVDLVPGGRTLTVVSGYAPTLLTSLGSFADGTTAVTLPAMWETSPAMAGCAPDPESAFYPRAWDLESATLLSEEEALPPVTVAVQTAAAAAMRGVFGYSVHTESFAIRYNAGNQNPPSVGWLVALSRYNLCPACE
jgi:hypothetical protein